MIDSRKFGVGAATLVLILAAAWFSLSPATGWLISGEPPVPADLLVVLGGGSEERVATGLQLYQAGMAPLILITGGQGFPYKEMRYLEDKGVPPRAILPPLRPAVSTYEDALTIRQVILRRKFRSVLVVTSPYHCRRVQLALNRVVGTLGVKCTVTPSISLYMDMEHWWRSHQGWITVSGEFPKLLWAWATIPRVTIVGESGLQK